MEQQPQQKFTNAPTQSHEAESRNDRAYPEEKVQEATVGSYYHESEQVEADENTQDVIKRHETKTR
ncbi:hypothetical protein PsorP6_015315 [Peronosclerospora sorghi]|uniref:Uncharacterized protein n=1 Tax=Peronosclerospora sorghi TaxID=230839 RepID=A0ACC0VV31_9STRA|nr:hypothetical protein PsorP6_015315 [Peronosclerospora sorghi]